MITKGETDFYDGIKNVCNVVFDVGCRDNTFYAETSKRKEFHLFEPNPKFYDICKKNIELLKGNKIILNNFGLGNKTAQLPYYEDAQSFLKRHVQYDSRSIPIMLQVKRFSEYLTENNINHIDLLKIDTEGYEPDILRDNIEFIKKNVEFIQFEYASTWLDRDDKVDLWDIFNIFKNHFYFCFLFDENHPLSKENKSTLTALKNKEDISIIDSWIGLEFGANIVMLRKEEERVKNE